MGAGKSLVAGVWRDLGAGIVEGDEMGRRALESDPALVASLVERFGRTILSTDGVLNRKKLAEVGFLNCHNQRDLTRLTFPALYRLAKQAMALLSPDHPNVVFDAALIFEWGIERDFDKIVVVTAGINTLLARAAARLGICSEEVKRRLDCQIAPEEKANRADFVIWNEGTEEDVAEAARKIWRQLI
jgi:dephospho-CoA kinase